MTEQNNSQQGIRFLVIAAALVIIIVGINQAQSVLVSFLVAVFFAIIGTPPVLWLRAETHSLRCRGAARGVRHDHHSADRRRDRRHVHQQLLHGVACLSDTLAGASLGTPVVFGNQRHPGHGQGSARIYQSGSGDEPDCQACSRGWARRFRTSS